MTLPVPVSPLIKAPGSAGSRFSPDHLFGLLMNLRAIAYISTAVSGLTSADIDKLLVDARAHNAIAGVTGILLYDGTHFFQYFEGPDEGVERIYNRIRASRMHVDIKELHSYPIERTYFTQWNMGCKEVDDSVLQKLSTQQWCREITHLSEDIEVVDSPALKDLVQFWEQSSQ